MEENDEPAPKFYMQFGPGMRAMLLMAMCFSCIGFFDMLSGAGQLSWLNPTPDNDYPLGYAWLAVSIRSVFIFGVPALVYANIFPAERFAFFRLNEKVSPLTLLYGALAMLVLIPGINQGANWIYESISNKELKDLEDMIQKIDVWFTGMVTFGDFIFCLVANAVIPAICEELFFRAGVQQILAERTRSFHIPIVATALIFTFFHADIVSLPFIFLAGLMLGYVFHWTGSLRVTMLMHFIFNGASILISYIAQHNENFASWTPSVLIVILSFVLSGGFFFLLWKKSLRLESKAGDF